MKIKMEAPDLDYHVSQLVEAITKDAQECLYALGMGILDQSALHVPVWTGSLLSTRFVAKEENGDIRIGYASDPSHDRMNPETGRYVSEYAWEVHEEGTIYDILRPVWVSGEGDAPGHYEYEEVTVQTHGPYKYLTTAANEVFRNWQEYFKDLPVEITENTTELIELEDGGFDEGYIPF